jgi:hypothetical protein
MQSLEHELRRVLAVGKGLDVRVEVVRCERRSSDLTTFV